MAPTARKKESPMKPRPPVPYSPSEMTGLHGLEDILDLGEDKLGKIPTNPMSLKDRWSAALLVVLYFLQGIPLGLTFGTLPFLLKAKASFSEMGLFSLASYPYSLKLFWSPVVDSVYLKSFGRRKSWIIPIQSMVSVMLFWIGSVIDGYLSQDHVPFTFLSLVFFTLVFLTATQDIAVDGWAITMLSEESRGYASTCQTVGLTAGQFFSFTIFLAFNSEEFSNQYVRWLFGWERQVYGILGLGGFIQFCGAAFLVVTLMLLLFVDEKLEADDNLRITDVYKQMWHIVKLPSMRKLIAVLLLCKIGFIANEAVTGLKLLEKGFKKEDLALTVLLDFPLQLFIGFKAAQYAREKKPLTPWLFGFQMRIALAVVGVLVIHLYPEGGAEPLWYFLFVLFVTFLTSCSSTIMMVSQGAFFAVICDPLIGGSYMTMLNTFSNLGFTWPQYFIFKLVDFFTVAQCQSTDSEVGFVTTFAPDCLNDESKKECAALGGTCVVLQDGYYGAAVLCFLLGLTTFVLYIRKTMTQLQLAPITEWRESRSQA